MQRPAIIEEIRAIIEEIRAEARNQPVKRRKREETTLIPDDYRYVFNVGTGNRWMELGEREPEAKMLFGEFWHQGELCILFADTNTGKSILAVQIANSISRRRPVAPFALNTPAAKVLYADFELTTKQFHTRYSAKGDSYNFPAKFIRAAFRPETAMPAGGHSYDEFIIAALEYRIRQLGAQVLIIDNISCLRGGTENTAVALSLMKKLKALKAQFNLSILVLAHTPKRRNPARPIATDDLQGSKMLINFADSAFAIGRSSAHDSLRYLKQVKQRSTEQLYGDDNVCLCHIQKMRNFLQFRFRGFGAEAPHLQGRSRSSTAVTRTQLARQAANLCTHGLTQREVSKQLGISLGLVNKLLNVQL